MIGFATMQTETSIISGKADLLVVPISERVYPAAPELGTVYWSSYRRVALKPANRCDCACLATQQNYETCVHY